MPLSPANPMAANISELRVDLAKLARLEALTRKWASDPRGRPTYRRFRTQRATLRRDVATDAARLIRLGDEVHEVIIVAAVEAALGATDADNLLRHVRKLNAHFRHGQLN